ncbi:MAG TPA: PH domain-containing protein [Clostridia bacterium]|nr:PH domain-containing protein [Clostridia bacterium]
MPSYETLSKKALKLMRITSVIGLFFLLAAAGILGGFLFIVGSTLGGVLTVAIAAVFCLAYFLVVPPIRFRRYTYLIAADRIEIIEGILFVTRTIVPIDRIHQIDIRRGPLDAATGVAKVIVTTAGSAAVFRFLEPERAEAIALYLNESISRKLKANENKEDEEDLNHVR